MQVTTVIPTADPSILAVEVHRLTIYHAFSSNIDDAAGEHRPGQDDKLRPAYLSHIGSLTHRGGDLSEETSGKDNHHSTSYQHLTAQTIYLSTIILRFPSFTDKLDCFNPSASSLENRLYPQHSFSFLLHNTQLTTTLHVHLLTLTSNNITTSRYVLSRGIFFPVLITSLALG